MYKSAFVHVCLFFMNLSVHVHIQTGATQTTELHCWRRSSIGIKDENIFHVPVAPEKVNMT